MKRSIILCLVFVFVINLLIGATNASPLAEADHILIQAAYIPNVGSISANLKNNILDNERYKIEINNFAFKQLPNRSFFFSGEIKGENFNITSIPYTTPANHNVQVFSAKDSLGNYDIIYSALEREISKSARYFTDINLSPYEYMLKLYLRPTQSTDFIVIEIFSDNVLWNSYFSTPISGAANAPSKIALFWYAKVFDPSISYKEAPPTRSYSTDYNTGTYTYQYNHLGLIYTQAFTIYRYISTPSSIYGSGDFDTKLEVASESTTCPDAPNENINETNIYIDNVRIDIAVDEGDACAGYEIDGDVATSGYIDVDFQWNGLSLFDIATITASYERSTTVDINAANDHLTNGPQEYHREVGMDLQDGVKLEDFGHYFSLRWTIRDYSGAKANQAFNVKFTYTMHNLLNYSHATTNGTKYYTDTKYYDVLG